MRGLGRSCIETSQPERNQAVFFYDDAFFHHQICENEYEGSQKELFSEVLEDG